ncbi:MAG: HAD hydrolase family protein [Proteobacteria bacterium]|nr:HAD hydrolase family protein [Pseudomonadota bacterium]MDE3207682.1 HAD hydrolase family protein [Pseudomonadota bacterium]
MPSVDTLASTIQLAIFDVDGVMTDASLLFTETGAELKIFNALDGHGLKLLKAGGIRLALLSGRTSTAVNQRAKDLGFDFVYQGIADKLPVLYSLQAQLGLSLADMSYMGDDVMDIPLLRRVGFALSVPNAPAIVREQAHYVTKTPGGHGAVREACELILNAQGKLEPLLAPYFS